MIELRTIITNLKFAIVKIAYSKSCKQIFIDIVSKTDCY